MLPDVAVLAGGVGYESRISNLSGEHVMGALARAGLRPRLLSPDRELLAALEAERPDAVFIALHGAIGEDGSIRRILELAGVPYVGTNAEAARSAWDKAEAKRRLREHGVRTPEWVTLPMETRRELGEAAVVERVVDALGLPLIVKPVQGGSGLGTTVVRNASEAAAAVELSLGFGTTALFEQYIAGRNLGVCVVQNKAGPEPLPPVEIEPVDGVYTTQARYDPTKTRWYCPARVGRDVLDRLTRTAVDVHTMLGLRDLSRIDMVVGDGGAVFVLGVNTSPGMTELSIFPRAVTAAERELGTLFSDLIADAITRPAA
jgi:D-alanine-D-alanine ligase